MNRIVPQELLHQHWVHSHEEDTDGEMVFRPATFNFPRSRGRMGFELKPDSRLIEYGIAPADGPRETQGTWKLEGNGQLKFYITSKSQPSRIRRVTFVDKERLVIRK